MRNIFFKLALKQASKIIGQPARITQLLAEMILKLKDINATSLDSNEIKDRFLLLGRYIKAHLTGKYLIQPRSLLYVLAPIIYFLNPFDLIPDFILWIGFTDDFAILGWVYSNIKNELDKFKAWEIQNAENQSNR